MTRQRVDQTDVQKETSRREIIFGGATVFLFSGRTFWNFENRFESLDHKMNSNDDYERNSWTCLS